jgi:hypothetical protein
VEIEVKTDAINAMKLHNKTEETEEKEMENKIDESDGIDPKNGEMITGSHDGDQAAHVETTDELFLTPTTPPIPPHSSQSSLTPILEDEGSDIVKDNNVSSVEDESFATPQAKVYQTRRKSLTHKTKPLKTPKKKKPTGPLTTKQEIAELRAVNATLSNAMNVLQETVINQGNMIASLSTKIEKMTVDYSKEVDRKVSNLEERIVNFYTDQEKQCSGKKVQITSAFNKRIDKLSTKLDVLQRCSTINSSDPPGQSIVTSLETKLNNLQTNIEKVEHEMAHMQDSISNLVDNKSPFTPVDSPLTRKMKMTAGKSNNTNSNRKGTKETQEDEYPRQTKDGTPAERKMSKSILFMDSNRKYLKADKLWKNCQMIPCSTTHDLRKSLLSAKLSDVDLIFIHTGVNDIDKDDGETVAKNLIEIVEGVSSTLPNMKIAISEITPRQLHRDEEVKTCNSVLHAALDNKSNVTIAKHSNLRNERWSFHVKDDDKHLTEVSIARFAKNLKVAFRTAFGMPLYEKRSVGNYNKNMDKQQKGFGNVETFKRKLLKFLNSC